jgi:hypothetical protein
VAAVVVPGAMGPAVRAPVAAATASRGTPTVAARLAAHRAVEAVALLGSMGESDGVTAIAGAPVVTWAGRAKERVSHTDLRDKAGCISYVRQRRTSHIMTECIEINVTNIIIT